MVSGTTGSPGPENHSSYYQNDGYTLDYVLFGAAGICWADEKRGDGDNEKAKEQPVGKDNLSDWNKRLLKSNL